MRKTAIVALLLGAGMLVTETVAAASISTRVRILEKKVRKHDRQIRANSYAVRQQRQKVDKVVSDVRRLNGRVDRLEQAVKAIGQPKQDKRYSYP